MKKKIIVMSLLASLVLFGVFLAHAAQSVYPLKSNVTLKYWMNARANATQTTRTFGDTEFAKELEKRTGVKVEYIHPPVGQTTDAFNIMLASGDLPDIIEYKWFDIPGGPSQAISDGYILKLNQVIKKYAPNLQKYLKQNPEIDRSVKTNEGNYYVFPFIRGGPNSNLLVTSGLVIRKDWLDELGLAMPETIDDWYVVLKAFKEKKGATIPLTAQKMSAFTSYTGSYLFLWSNFSGAFNTYFDFYVENGKVKHGYLDPGRKEFMITMNKWYNEGLLDPNFASTDAKMVTANIISGKSGAAHGSAGSGIGKWMQAMAEKNPEVNLVAVPCPGPKKGVLPKYRFIATAYGRESSNGSAAITSKCRNVEAAARLLDYGYSPEGKLFFNFGIEGISYNLVNGQPTYTNLIMKNPDFSPSEIMSRYLRAQTDGPFVQDERYLEQYYELPQQKQAIVQWSKTSMFKHILPPVTPSKEKADELARILNDVTTYSDETMLKYIMGIEPISSYPKYIAEIKKMGIDRAVAIMQESLDNYYKRK